MLGHEVGLDVPDVHALALADAARVIGHRGRICFLFVKLDNTPFRRRLDHSEIGRKFR